MILSFSYSKFRRIKAHSCMSETLYIWKSLFLTLLQRLSTLDRTSCWVGLTRVSDLSCSTEATSFRNVCSFSSAARVSPWLDCNLLSSSFTCFSKQSDSRRPASITRLLALTRSTRVSFSVSMFLLPTTSSFNSWGSEGHNKPLHVLTVTVSLNDFCRTLNCAAVLVNLGFNCHLICFVTSLMESRAAMLLATFLRSRSSSAVSLSSVSLLLLHSSSKDFTHSSNTPILIFNLSLSWDWPT